MLGWIVCGTTLFRLVCLSYKRQISLTFGLSMTYTPNQDLFLAKKSIEVLAPDSELSLSLALERSTWYVSSCGFWFVVVKNAKPLSFVWFVVQIHAKPKNRFGLSFHCTWNLSYVWFIVRYEAKPTYHVCRNGVYNLMCFLSPAQFSLHSSVLALTSESGAWFRGG